MLLLINLRPLRKDSKEVKRLWSEESASCILGLCEVQAGGIHDAFTQ